jgi:hypothetical protein
VISLFVPKHYALHIGVDQPPKPPLGSLALSNVHDSAMKIQSVARRIALNTPPCL